MSKQHKPTKQEKELTATVQRLQADFENYRKRMEAEKQNWAQDALCSFVCDLLPVLDNFSRAIEHVPENQRNESWVQGIFYIKKQLEDTLASAGVSRIECKVGDKFDPNVHEAVGVSADVTNDTADTGDSADTAGNAQETKITKIELTGYKLGDKILRPAKVIVSK